MLWTDRRRNSFAWGSAAKWQQLKQKPRSSMKLAFFRVIKLTKVTQKVYINCRPKQQSARCTNGVKKRFQRATQICARQKAYCNKRLKGSHGNREPLRSLPHGYGGAAVCTTPLPLSLEGSLPCSAATDTVVPHRVGHFFRLHTPAIFQHCHLRQAQPPHSAALPAPPHMQNLRGLRPWRCPQKPRT